MNEVNAQRKYDQSLQGQELQKIELQISKALEKNIILERECKKLENELHGERKKKLVFHYLFQKLI